MSARRQSGQARLEVIGVLPALVVAIALVWQLAAFVRAGVLVHQDARTKALGQGGSGVVRVVAERRVASVIPGVGPFLVRASAATVAP